jgi:hypothetical protein
MNSRVPLLAMVPRCETASLGAHADAVVADGDGLGLGVEPDADLQVGRVFVQRALLSSASKRSLSQASEALETSSRRKISLLEYSEWVTRCRICLTSAWKQFHRFRREFFRQRSVAEGLRGAHAHQVFLFDRGVFSDQRARNAAVLRQHQQTVRIDVQSPGRRQAAQVIAVEALPRRVAHPLVFRKEQHAGGLVSVFGLTADIADRLVHQHRHPLRLLDARFLVHFHLLVRQHALAQNGGFAVDRHPAAHDPVVGFATRRGAAVSQGRDGRRAAPAAARV